MELSVVTSLYKSAAFVDDFHARVTAAARQITDAYEIVMVDDGSPDNSLDLAVALANTDPHVRVVELSRNFGHHKALMCGMEHATGDLVLLIDSDLEEPPELLQQFYDVLHREDCDVVYAYQRQRRGDAMDRLGGGFAWYLVRKLYSVDAPRNQCTMRLMRHDYVRSLLLHREQPPVLGALFVITGYRQVGLPIDKGQRETSTYTLTMRVRAFLDGLTSFSTVPLNLISTFGLLISILATLFGIGVVLARLIYNTSVGWASVMASVWFLGGAIIFCTGIIGIYVNHVFLEVKHRPYTIVRRVHQKNTLTFANEEEPYQMQKVPRSL